MSAKTNPKPKCKGITFFKNQDNIFIINKILKNPDRTEDSFKVFLTKNRFYVVFNSPESAVSFARGFNKARHTKDNLATISPPNQDNTSSISHSSDPYVRGFSFASKLEYLITKLESDDELLIRAEIL